MARSSLRRRLVALLLGATGCAWVAVGMLTYADARHEIDTVLDAHLEQAATLLAARARHEQDEAESEDEHGDRDEARPYAAPVTFQVWDRDGRLLRRSAGAPATPLTAVAEGFDDASFNGSAWRTYSHAANGFVVQVAESRTGRERAASQFLRHTLWPLLIGLPLFGLLAWAAVSRALRPLALLGDDLRRRRASDLGPVGVGDVPEEVAPLVAQLDDLFARIRDRLDAERRFTSDAAHELRTPIAGIRAQAEAALGATSGGERDAALHRVVAACDRLSRVVAQLLTLARMDEMPSATPAPCRLDEIASAVVADLAPRAVDGGVDLGLVATVAAPARLDPLLAEVLVRNLVDNAVRYGGRGARVDVGVARDGDTSILTVSDDGPGLAPADLARLGQPFFRAGQASGTGTGLGLSIVLRIAQRYRGSVSFTAGPGGRGLLAQVSFPD